MATRDAVSISFRCNSDQAVDGLLQEMGGRMLRAVGRTVRLSRTEPEVGRDVYRSRPVVDQGSERLGAGPAGQGRKGHVDRHIDRPGDREVDLPQMRQDFGQPLPRGTPPGDGHDLHLGVTVEYPGQLGSRISRYVEYSDLQSLFLLSRCWSSIAAKHSPHRPWSAAVRQRGRATGSPKPARSCHTGA